MRIRFYSLPRLNGNYVDLDYGSYTQAQLAVLIGNISSFSIPPRMSVTLYNGPNLNGPLYIYSNPGTKSMKITSFVDFVPGLEYM